MVHDRNQSIVSGPLTRISRSLLRWMRTRSKDVSNLPLASRRTMDACELECRLLYSGSPMPVEMFVAEAPVELQAEGDTSYDVQEVVAENPFDLQRDSFADWSGLVEESEFASFSQLGEPESSSQISELIFIDTGVEGYQAMLDDLHQQYGDSQHVQIVLLESGNGVSQIADTLNKHNDVKAIHLVSHSSGTGVELGDVQLTRDNLQQYAGEIALWNHALSADADILFYGCNLAGSTEGLELLESIAILTEADVAASEDLTGHASLGGDWDLEIHAGNIESGVVFSYEFQRNWHSVLATVVVDTTGDFDPLFDPEYGDTSSIAALLSDKGSDGLISLREAIDAANNTPNGGVPHQINFDIVDGSANQFYYTDDGVAGSVTTANIADATVLGGEGFLINADPDHPFTWFQIDLDNSLPELVISQPIIIDGYSQWGASENTLATGSDAVLRIEITNSAGDGNRGFLIQAAGGGSTFTGLVINDFGQAAILASTNADGNTFQGNYIGTDVTGTIGIGNQEGIHLRSGDNLVGGADPGDRNVIADNNSRGVITFTFGAIETGNIVQNNYIGVDSSGLAGLGNGGSGGIQVYNQDGMQIMGNVISGNANDGIIFLAGGDAFNTIVVGNNIGVGADGTTIIANGDDGIRIESDLATGNRIGGTAPGEGNVIAGNNKSGIVLDGSALVSNTTIVGNFIGTDVTGILDLGNVDHGILIENGAINNTVGGITPGTANVIAFNEKDGVNIKDGLSDGNAILGNSIYNNDDLGIDVNDDGVTSNDDFDGDGGPNDRLNHPVITAVTTDGGGTVNVSGWFTSTPGVATYRVEFFASPTPDSSGYGEGQTFIGFIDITTDANGFASFNQSFAATVGIGEVVSATSTDLAMNTSEFGWAMPVEAVPAAAPVNGIWMSTILDVSPSGAPGLGDWTEGEIISFGGPTLELETGGTIGEFSSVINLDVFASDDVNIDGMHYVTQSTTVGFGANSIILQVGDVLLSTDDDESFFGGTFDVDQEDVFVFRPDSPGDYSSGNMFMLLDMSSPTIIDPDLGFGDLWSLTLVEQDVTIGGYDLFAGEVLFTRDGGGQHQDIYVFHVTDAGLNVTAGTADKLIEGTVLGFSDKIIGLDIVETPILIGDESLSAGTLLISLDTDTRILDFDADTSDDFDVTRQDIISFDISQTEMNGGTTYNGAYVLFEGLDVGLETNQEDIDAFTIASAISNTDPVLGNNQLTLNEGQTITLDSSNFDASDLETSDPNLVFTVTSVNGGHFALSTDTLTPIFAFTKAQIDAGDIVFVDNGDETAPSYDVEVGDSGGLIDGPAAGTINFTNVNDAPLLDNTGTMFLDRIAKDETASAGNSVAEIIASAGGDRITDAEGDPEGIAIVSFDDTSGTWEFSTNGGATWNAMTTVLPTINSSNALLLDATAMIRFVPDPGFIGNSGNISFHAWDGTDGNLSGAGGVDVTTNGDPTAFSTEFETASIVVVEYVDANSDSFTIDENDAATSVNVLTNDNLNGINTVIDATLNYDANEDTDGNSNWVDQAGTGFDVTLNPGVVYDTSPSNPYDGIHAAFEMNGAGAELNVPLQVIPPTDPTQSSASFEIWFNPSDAVGQEILFDIGNLLGTTLKLNEAQLEFHSSDLGNFVSTTADLSGLLSGNEYIHVVGVLDMSGATTMELYVNGTLQDADVNAAHTDWAGSFIDGIGLGIFEGTSIVTASPGVDPFEGEIQSFRFYESALNAAQIAQNYAAASLVVSDHDAFSAQGIAVTVSANGDVTYDPGTAFDYLKNGDVLIDTFTYTVTNGLGETDTETVTITINGENDDPGAGAAISESHTEDEPTFVVDLLSGSSDVEGDTLNVSGLTLDSGNAVGVTVIGNTLSVDPNAWNFLAAGESEVIQYSYDVIDGEGGSASQSATITITGVNDDPNVGPAITAGATEDAAIFGVDLLAGSSDPDASDTINVSNLSLTSGNAAGVTILGNNLSIDPSAYNYLAASESETIQYSYDVIDGNGGTVAQTATITITGINDGPSVGVPVTGGSTEDDPGFSVDLLNGAADPDTSDTLNVSGLTLDSGNAVGVTVAGNNLNIDPAAWNFLAVGETETIQYSYNVIDGNGGTVAQTATITITGVNDAPIVSASVSASANQDDPSFVVDLLINASDPDISDTINVAGLTLISGNAAGITIGSPTANDLTVDPSFYSYLAVGDFEVIVFDYTVEDGNGGSATQTATITISGSNEDPVISGSVSGGATEDDPVFNVDLLSGASDPDTGDTLNVSNLTLTGGNAAGVTVLVNSLDVDPSVYDYLAVGESETITYSYDIIDGNGGTVAQTATITITGLNDGPTVSLPVISNVSEDDPGYSVDLLTSAVDLDASDTLSVTALSLTGGDASGITVAGNSLNVDPSAYNDLAVGESEVISYSYTIVDGNGGSVDQTATITISGVNDAPTIGLPVSGGATEDDATFNVDLLSGASDPDSSDTINATSITLTGGNAVGVTILGNNLSVDPTAYNDLAVGETETITYSYNVDDGNGGLTAQTATITITGVNDDPTVTGVITAGATEDDPGFVVDLLSGSNDDDLGDVLTVTNLMLLSGDASGITVGATDLTVDPNAYNSLALGETNVIQYSYDLDDGNGGVVSQTATITITGLNDAPIAVNDLAGVIEDTPRTFDALINDFDPDAGDTLSVSIVLGMGPSNGSVIINGDNTFTYTPNLNYNGPDSFTYEISDGNGGVDQATVTINVTPSNDPPTVDNPIGTVTVDEDDPDSTFDLTAVFGDVDDPVLMYNILSNDNPGLVTDSLLGNTLTLDYVADQFGSATIVVTATDSAGQVAIDTITLIVNPVNDAPTVDSPVPPIVVNEDAPDTMINLTAVFGDIDDVTLTHSLVSNDNGSLVSATVVGDNLWLDYQDNQNGSANVVVRAVDAMGLAATHTVQVDVTPVNDAPEVINHEYDVEEDGSITGNVLAGSMDIENDSLTVSLINGPSSGTLMLNPNGTFTFTPAEGFFGNVSFQFQATDGADVSNIATATIKVEAGPYTPPGGIDPDPDPDPDPEPETGLPQPGDNENGTVEEAPRVIDVRQFEDFVPQEMREQEGLNSNGRVQFVDTPLQYFEYRVQLLETRLTESDASRYIAMVDVTNPMLFASLDNFAEDLDEVVDNLGVALVGSLVSLSGVSIGVVSWILRSSALITSLMANMPAWRLIDPLVVLGYDEEMDSGESVEDIIEASEEVQPRPALKSETPSVPN